MSTEDLIDEQMSEPAFANPVVGDEFPEIELDSSHPSPLNIDIDPETHKEELNDLDEDLMDSEDEPAGGEIEDMDDRESPAELEMDNNSIASELEDAELDTGVTDEADTTAYLEGTTAHAQALVVELDSEDEIDNLESDDEPAQPSEVFEVLSEDGEEDDDGDDDEEEEVEVVESQSQGDELDSDTHHSESEWEVLSKPNQGDGHGEVFFVEAPLGPDGRPLFGDGGGFGTDNEVTHENDETSNNGETEQDLNNADQSIWSQVPIFIDIRGDEFLLIPFFEKCQYELQDMISLFSRDEVSGRKFNEFFELLRGNGDLIDAYNFNVDDELKIDIPEVRLCLTEDNVYTNNFTLDDLLDCFITLRKNSFQKGEKQVPDKLTIYVSMQQRFITKYKALIELADDGCVFADVYKTLGHLGDKEVVDAEDGQAKKKRKIEYL